MESALELARLIGRDEELKQTIARDDYEGFQRLIQEILSIGEGSQQQQQTQNSQQQSNLSSVLGG